MFWIRAWIGIGILAASAAAQQDEWSPLLEQARQSLTRGEYPAAVEGLRAALQKGAPKLENTRLLAAALRAAGKREEALATFEDALKQQEEAAARPEEIATDLNRLATFKIELGDKKTGKEMLLRALGLWAQGAGGGTAELAAMDALAVLHRDAGEYEEAEALLVRALRSREVAYGPNASELISTVDSLAYVLFGQKKFAEAEPLFKRLLFLWESSAGPEHPMVALTLDKMAEFYAFQQRYGEAEPLVVRSLAMRTNVLMASFNQTGRVALMQAKLTESRELYERAIRIGDDCKVDDAVIDPLLRIESKLLRAMDKNAEADKIDERVNAALMRKAEREGRLPAPGMPRK
jgi:tetratricopeptide (TPR) repeat protein